MEWGSRHADARSSRVAQRLALMQHKATLLCCSVAAWVLECHCSRGDWHAALHPLLGLTHLCSSKAVLEWACMQHCSVCTGRVHWLLGLSVAANLCSSKAHLSVLGHSVRASLQLRKDCPEECGAGLLSLQVCCICRRPQHLPGDMGVELQIPDVRGRPMLRQRQRCSRKVALLRLLLGMPAAQSVLTMQPGTPLDLVRRVTR